MQDESEPTSRTARQEWADGWQLPGVAMLGLTASAIFAYSSGVFMEPMLATFGWNRTAFSFAFTLQMTVGLIALPTVGWLVDRFGPRRVALLGSLPFLGALSLLGLASGSVVQWWLLCALLAVFQAFVAQTVWISATVERFHAARGLAMSIVLAGLGVGTLVWPVLAAFYIERFGWRGAYPALALTWAVVVLPLAWRYFHGSPVRVARSRGATRRRDLGRELRSGTFVMLVLAGGLFSSGYYGLVVHLVPILRGRGLDLQSASLMAGLVGLFSIVGRLGTGALLDRYPVRPIGVAVFLLPVLSCLLMLASSSLPVLLLAVALLGLATGAELDLVTFIAARRFGPEVFGSIYSLFVSLIALSASTGPLLGGALYDHSGSYTPFLLTIIPMALTCTLLMALMPLGRTGSASPPDS